MSLSALLESDTSHQAYVSVQPHISRMEASILTNIRECGPATCDELEQVLHLSHQCCSARIRGLVLKNLLVSDGTAKTRSGRKALIWKLRA